MAYDCRVSEGSSDKRSLAVRITGFDRSSTIDLGSDGSRTTLVDDWSTTFWYGKGRVSARSGSNIRVNYLHILPGSEVVGVSSIIGVYSYYPYVDVRGATLRMESGYLDAGSLQLYEWNGKFPSVNLGSAGYDLPSYVSFSPEGRAPLDSPHVLVEWSGGSKV
jgi:hypothetical protein